MPKKLPKQDVFIPSGKGGRGRWIVRAVDEVHTYPDGIARGVIRHNKDTYLVTESKDNVGGYWSVSWDAARGVAVRSEVTEHRRRTA